MIKRLVKVLVVIPCLLLILPIEIIIYGIRWIVTGKDFPKQPLIGRILFPLESSTKPFETQVLNANIATLPEREQYLKQVIESIYNQVDVLEVALNNYKAVPDWANEYPKATFTIRANEKGDGEKFLNAEYQDGYIFTIDDDLIYPPDYCRRMVEHVERYKRKVVVSLHGRTFNPRPIASYYKSRIKGYHWNNDQITDVRVHTAGTGVMCWHSDTIKIKYADIKAANMADIWMGLFTERLGIPLMCVNHRTGWLRYILPDNIQTIYDVHYESDVLQTEIWNQG